jgi:hypothetical protein
MTTTGGTEPRPNLHFRLDGEDVAAAKRRARREYRTLTDVVAAAVAAYGAGKRSVTFPEPADPDE